MKKKLALLMALIMMLSVLPIVPMGVFGQSVTVRPGTILNQRENPFATPASVTLRIDSAALSSINVADGRYVVLQIRFTGGGNAGYVGFSTSQAAISFGGGSGWDATPAAENLRNGLNAMVNDQGRRTAFGTLTDGPWDGARDGAVRGLDINIGNLAFATLDGFLDLTLNNVRGAHAEANVTVSITTGGGPQGLAFVTTELADVRLVRGALNRGVTIESVSVVPFGVVGHLSGIRVRENAIGQLRAGAGNNSVATVRLLAPRGFAWETGDMDGIVGSGVNASSNDAVFPAAPTVTIPANHTGYVTALGRHELVLQVNLGEEATGFTAATNLGYFVLRGVSLIPLENAATSGPVSIDVYVSPNAASVARTGGLNTWNEGAPGVDGAAGAWRERGLTVATLDEVGEISVTAAETVRELRSGAPTPTNHTRWLNHANNDRAMTVRISEEIPGAMFRNLDIFELRAVDSGVNINAVQTRITTAGVDAANRGWADVANNSNDHVLGFHRSTGGSVRFAPLPLSIEPQSRLRSMDIALNISVEAGFAARNGEDVRLAVYRNGVYIDTVTIATVEDPIRIVQGDPRVITRYSFDVLPLIPVAGFTVQETAPGMLANGTQLWFSLQATQNGRPVSIPMGGMQVFSGNAVVNTVASDMVVSNFTTPAAFGLEGGFGVTINRTSVDVASEISFNDIYLAGPTVPGVEWHVVLHSPQVTAGSAPQTGYAFSGMPYYATVLVVDGTPDIVEAPGPGDVDVLATVPVTFSPATILNGAPAIIIHDGATLIQTRAFTDSFGGSITAAGNVVTAIGLNRRTGQETTIVMQIGSPTVTIDGGPSIDISTIVGQPTMFGRIVPVNVDGRAYVPVRFLAEVFGIPFSRTSGNGIRFN